VHQMRITIVTPDDNQRRPWVTIEDWPDCLDGGHSEHQALPAIRVHALPAWIEELVFLWLRHGEDTALAFARRTEWSGPAVAEPRLF